MERHSVSQQMSQYSVNSYESRQKLRMTILGAREYSSLKLTCSDKPHANAKPNLHIEV